MGRPEAVSKYATGLRETLMESRRDFLSLAREFIPTRLSGPKKAAREWSFLAQTIKSQRDWGAVDL